MGRDKEQLLNKAQVLHYWLSYYSQYFSIQIRTSSLQQTGL